MKNIGFKEKIVFEKNDCFNILNSISNNVMINNLINDLINYNGVTNFFCDNNNYAFKNDKGEYVYIFISSDNVYVKNNFDGNNHELNYHLNNDGSVDIDITIYSKVECPNYDENRTVECLIKYDSNGDLILNRKSNTSYLSSNDIDMNNQLRDYLYENYRVVTSDYLVDGNLVREKVTNYFNKPNLEKKEYYYSDYEVGMLGSGDASKYIKPKFSKIDLNRFSEIKGVQKVKSFI